MSAAPSVFLAEFFPISAAFNLYWTSHGRHITALQGATSPLSYDVHPLLTIQQSAALPLLPPTHILPFCIPIHYSSPPLPRSFCPLFAVDLGRLCRHRPACCAVYHYAANRRPPRHLAFIGSCKAASTHFSLIIQYLTTWPSPKRYPTTIYFLSLQPLQA